MERRFVVFLTLSFGILLLYSWLMPKPAPRPKQEQAAVEKSEKTNPPDTDKKEPVKTAEKSPEKPVEKSERAATVMQAAPEPESSEQWVALGSADKDDPYRMLVTLTTKGAAVERIELNSPRYCDIDDRNGYLGHLVLTPAPGGKGCVVQFVGPGTPAAEAGVKAGDVLAAVNRKPIAEQADLEAVLAKTKPKQLAELDVLRRDERLTLSAQLRRRPLEVIKPEGNDPLSMLLTLNSVDDLKLTTQLARDVAIYRLYADLKLSEQEIADLNLADINLNKEESTICLPGEIDQKKPGEAKQEKKWIPLTPEIQKALVVWLPLRGAKTGPLFIALPHNNAKLDNQNIHNIIVRMRADEEGSGQLELGAELDGVHLRRGTWILASAKPDEAVFRKQLPSLGLEITKTYRLAKVLGEESANADFPAYHLEFDIEIRNVGGEAHKIAYRLDGPNGLPTEGKWYSNKVSRNWGGAGLRDFVISFEGGTPGMIGAPTIADGKDIPKPWSETDNLLTFIGIDAQYFSAVLMPLRQKANDAWFEELMPIRMGKVDPKYKTLTNSSCRLIGKVQEIAPGEAIVNQFRLFTGPKKPAILENQEYRLGELIYYGWPIFAMVAKPLTVILHWFYAVTHNYGLAIIMLTILVRSCMFPLSLKQTAGAQKMQQLQPEIKKLQEKHKNNVEARTKAQQELFRKHNYNPLAGCLPVFIQLPVFLGLYRSLMVSIELRDAPLITNSIRWCSNLAAPDMLYNWEWIMPAFVSSGMNGIFSLGPYFNLLPLLTIALFIGQQKMMMPPAADEQAAMQQKIMQYMMIFMGLMFFKVASGLCIYFIASSLWGLGERKFLPKPPPPAGGDSETRADAKARERQTAAKEKR